MLRFAVKVTILLLLVVYSHLKPSPVEISTLGNPTNAPSEIFSQDCIQDKKVIYSFTSLLGILISSDKYDETRELQHADSEITLYYKIHNLGGFSKQKDQVTRNDILKWQNYLRLYLSKEDINGEVEPICEVQVIRIKNFGKNVVLTYGTDSGKVESLRYDELEKRDWDLVQQSNEYGFKDVDWTQISVLAVSIFGIGKLASFIGF